MASKINDKIIGKSLKLDDAKYYSIKMFVGDGCGWLTHGQEHFHTNRKLLSSYYDTFSITNSESECLNFLQSGCIFSLLKEPHY